MKTREERVQTMREAVDDIRAKAMAQGMVLSPVQAEELIQWAGIEFAAVEHLTDSATRVIRAVHPSTVGDGTRVEEESAMYLLQCGCALADRAGLSLETVVKAIAVYYKTAGELDKPEDDEQSDFEGILYAGSN